MSNVDDVTKRWIRNRSDELAVANGCRFDEERAQFVVDWIQTHCRLWEGAKGPLILGDWQLEATMRLFGWIRWSERLGRWIRRFRKAGIWVSKKNAKSPTAAAWALYLIAGDGEDGNHVFFCATDGNQARIVGNHAVRMVKASPELDIEQGGSIAINLVEMKLTHRPTLSDAKPLSSGDNRAAKSKQGLNGSVIIDETHVVTHQFISESSIDMAGSSRDEPLHIEISTAGKDPDGYGRKQYDYGKKVESGEVEDDRYFFLCYEAPQNLSDADLDADPVKWGRMANPSWGRIIQEDEFLATYKEKKQSLADLADFKTFRLGIWQQSASPWISIADWEQCRSQFTESAMEGRICAAGLDLAITRDMSALSFVFPWDDDRFRWLVRFYLPEAGLRRLALKEPRALDWANRYITVTPGETTDYRYIRRDFADAAKRFQISQLIFDEHFAEQVTQEMHEDTGVDRFKLPQTITRLNEPTQNMERLILERKIEHNGNPVLTWQMGHVNIKSDANGNKRPVKPPLEDHKKIDGPVSGIMALAGARQSDADDNWFQADEQSRKLIAVEDSR